MSDVERYIRERKKRSPKFFGNSFLGDPGLFSSLSEHYAELERFIPGFKVLSKLWTPFLAFPYVSFDVTHGFLLL